VASRWKSPVKLVQTKGDTILFLKKIGFSMNEIKQLTTLQVNLYIQRYNEPLYKEEIDEEIIKAKSKE